MAFEEIEDRYKKELESTEKIFLDGTKARGNLKDLERNYKVKVKKIRETYYRSISDQLTKQKKSILNKKKTLPPLDRRVFKADTSSIELSFLQKTRYRLALLLFKISFAIRNTLRDHTPNMVLYYYIKLKKLIKKIIIKVQTFFENLVKQIIDFFEKNYASLVEFLTKTYKKLMELPGKLIERLSKKKEKKEETKSSLATEEKKEEGTEEGEKGEETNDKEETKSS